MATFDSDPFPAAALRGRFKRADVELHEVDQVVASYEGRLFVNNPGASARTPLDESNGYVGSFYVFGKVDCWGETDDHCSEPERERFDRRRSPTRYAKVRVKTPEGVLERAAADSSGNFTLHVVAVLPGDEDEAHAEAALRFGRLSIITYA